MAHQTSRSPETKSTQITVLHNGALDKPTWNGNVLSRLHEGGMTGIGEKYKTLIELAAQRTGLSTEHIKVMLNVKNLT